MTLASLEGVSTKSKKFSAEAFLVIQPQLASVDCGSVRCIVPHLMSKYN